MGSLFLKICCHGERVVTTQCCVMIRILPIGMALIGGRARSLDLIDGMWYLLYEGATAVDHTCYRDSIGLARSKDLLNWETHPLKVAVPQQAGEREAAVEHDAVQHDGTCRGLSLLFWVCVG